MDILIGTKVITSRGRFGIVIETKDDTTYVIKMGSKLYDIAKDEVIPAQDTINVEVVYLNSDFKEDKIILFLHRQLLVFNFQDPISNNAYDICKKHLSTRLGNIHFTIQTIKIV